MLILYFYIINCSEYFCNILNYNKVSENLDEYPYRLKHTDVSKIGVIKL